MSNSLIPALTWPSYLNNENPYTSNDCLYIEMTKSRDYCFPCSTWNKALCAKVCVLALSMWLPDCFMSGPIYQWGRLIHSLSLVDTELSLGYDTSLASKPTQQLHKSYNAPVPHPTIHHFGTEMCTFLFQSGVLWGVGQVYILPYFHASNSALFST